MLVKVRVHLRSRQVRFELKGGVIHAWLTEPAEKGKANRQLLKELSSLAGPCRLVKGAASVNKLLEVPLPLKTLEELLG